MRTGEAFDAGAVTCEWARALMQPDGARALEVTVAGKGIQLVGDREYSQRVLGDFPSSRGYAAGVPKVSAMSFLAPHALTIADGEAWERLRPFNERVLGTGGIHPYAQAILDRVNAAFSRPVPDVAGLRAAMGRAMVGIVLGDATPGGAQAAEDVRDLFGVVQNPVKRKLLGWRYRSRHRRLYEVLGRAWDAATPADQTLIARARYGAPAGDRTTMLEQVPHWMFTFTGSGTDLLARTLVLVTSRPAILRRVVDEVHAAGPLEQPGPVERLPLVEACLLETGRLFPPVTRTFHSHPARPGTPTLAHWFPLLQRDDRLAQGVHEFTPDRWLGPELDAAAAASNLFLRGPRACPGMDLILFVSKVALARLVAGFGITAPHARLASDPLPVSFPGIPSRFNVPEVAP
jgi:cytochrome P450